MAIVWGFCLGRIPECSNYGDLANSLLSLVRKKKKKPEHAHLPVGEPDCFPSALVLVGWGLGAFEQHLGSLWLAALGVSWPGDLEGGRRRPWHGH